MVDESKFLCSLGPNSDPKASQDYFNTLSVGKHSRLENRPQKWSTGLNTKSLKNQHQYDLVSPPET